MELVNLVQGISNYVTPTYKKLSYNPTELKLQKHDLHHILIFKTRLLH